MKNPPNSDLHRDFDPQLHSNTGISKELRNIVLYQKAELDICESLASSRRAKFSRDASFYRVRTVLEHIEESVHRDELLGYLPGQYVINRIDAQVFVLNITLQILFGLEDSEIDAQEGNDFYLQIKRKIADIIENIESIISGKSLQIPQDLGGRVYGLLSIPAN